MNYNIFSKSSSFGLDIGKNSIKVVQIKNSNTKKLVLGYGYNTFNPSALKDGEIINFQEIKRCIVELFDKKVIGEIYAKNVVTSVPITYTFTRVINIPIVSAKDLQETVLLEAEQYIPTSITELYIDHDIIARSKDQQEVLIVAVPKKIIDSYIKLFSSLGISISSIETSMDSILRLLRNSNLNEEPSLIVDLGSNKSNLAVVDSTVRVTGYTSTGGDQITKAISERLNVTLDKADEIKINESLHDDSNAKIVEEILENTLDGVIAETKRIITYYNKNYPSSENIKKLILVGGSSQVPGLNSFFESKLHLPVKLLNPWEYFIFHKITPPNEYSHGVFATSVGLALANFEKAFKIKDKVLSTKNLRQEYSRDDNPDNKREEAEKVADINTKASEASKETNINSPPPKVITNKKLINIDTSAKTPGELIKEPLKSPEIKPEMKKIENNSRSELTIPSHPKSVHQSVVTDTNPKYISPIIKQGEDRFK